MKERLVEAIADVREDEALELAKKLLDSGSDPAVALEACREAMAIVGKRYEEGEYFLPHLIIAGDILKAIGELVKPRMKGAAAARKAGKVVIGTVAGDIHDIGKDVVAFMLEGNEFEVHDLGVDVPPEKFVEAIRAGRPGIVGMSGFLTLAFDQMKATVEAIRAAGLRDDVRIMIGGAPMDDAVARYVGADAYGRDATAAVRLAKAWVEGK
jgi:methanogenic corrinoid protein MtbC1